MDGPEGSCHRLNLRTPDTGMLLDYTFADHKDYTTYRPLRTFYGYRFVSITADQEVRIRSIRSIPVSSITQQMETGSITTGNKLVNQLISNTLWDNVPTTFRSYRLSAAQRTAGMDRRHAGIC